MNLVSLLSPYFEPYVTLRRVHPSQTYDYKSRGFFALPVVEVSMHKPKCSPDSWLYVAAPAEATLTSLEPGQKLYVGSRSSDRMFRGDAMNGRNFHHAQMRAGNGDDNMVNYLRVGGRVTIHCINAGRIAGAFTEVPNLHRFRPLLAQTPKHVGYWLEQYVLMHELKDWRWNTAGADSSARAVLQLLQTR